MPLLSSLVPISLDSWKFWLYFRVISVVLSGLWCGFGLATLINYKPILLMTIGGVLGLLLSFNPFIDLINGPVHGIIQSHSTTQLRGLNNAGSGSRIKGELSFTDSKGNIRTINPSGLHANRMEFMLKGCESEEVIVLLYMDILLNSRCK